MLALQGDLYKQSSAPSIYPLKTTIRQAESTLSSACCAIRTSLHRGERQRKELHVWWAVELNARGMCVWGSLAVLTVKGHNVSLLYSNLGRVSQWSRFPGLHQLIWGHLHLLYRQSLDLALVPKKKNKFHLKKRLGNCRHVSLLSLVQIMFLRCFQRGICRWEMGIHPWVNKVIVSLKYSVWFWFRLGQHAKQEQGG